MKMRRSALIPSIEAKKAKWPALASHCFGVPHSMEAAQKLGEVVAGGGDASPQRQRVGASVRQSRRCVNMCVRWSGLRCAGWHTLRLLRRFGRRSIMQQRAPELS